MENIWYRGGREIVRSYDINRIEVFNITQEYYDDYIGNQKTYDGDLFLSQTNITSLGSLETVNGMLYLGGTHLTSLGNLKHVGGKIAYSKDSPTHKLLLGSEFKDKIKPTYGWV